MGSSRLTPRERVRLAGHRQPVDRVPLDFGGRNVSMLGDLPSKLLAYLGISDALAIPERYGGPEEPILQRLGIDCRHIELRTPPPLVEVDGGQQIATDEWGIRHRLLGSSMSVVGPPLRSAGIDDLEIYPWPDADDPRRTKELADRVQFLYRQTDYAIVADGPVGGVVARSITLRGYEEFLIDMMINRDFAQALMGKVFDLQFKFYRIYLEIVGPYVEVMQVSDDLGSQSGLLISPGLYRELIKPYHKRLIDFIRGYTGALILFHTCGSVYDLIEDFIEIGVDLLSPVQPRAAKMEPQRLKDEFGDRIGFHGGIDTQQILPHGTVAEVREHVKQVLESFDGGGGYILAPAHNLQNDVPPQNVVAMFEAAREFGTTPLLLRRRRLCRKL